MAASRGSSKTAELSKAEYLKRYLSTDERVKKSKRKIKKKNPTFPQKGLKIVDDDIDWKQMVKEEEIIEEDEDEAPVIAEVIDERPEEVKQMEAFRTSNRWKVFGANEEEEEKGQCLDSEVSSRSPQNSPELSTKFGRHDSPEGTTQHSCQDVLPAKRGRHDSPDISPPRKSRHDSPDISPPRRRRHDSPDISPPRKSRYDSPDIAPPRKSRHDSPDISPPRRRLHDSPDISPPRRRRHDSPDRIKPTSSSLSKKNSSPNFHRSSLAKQAQKRYHSDSDQSPPRKKPQKGEASDSDQSPPRRQRHSGTVSDEDLSPPRRPGPSQDPRMLSGGKAGLLSVDVLRKEQDENRRRERDNRPLEEESRNAQTVFRDKSGKRRNLDSEREEQRKKAGEKAAKDEKYAQWGKGLAQTEMQQQKLDYALQEAQKPLARHCDDEDLDRMLREQEREGDPMAAMLRRKKERTTNMKEKPRYKGPTPPPNRFNILPGYRWDGVDRSNGFEQKRYMRMADRKAVQEEAYKWSVEDM